MTNSLGRRGLTRLAAGAALLGLLAGACSSSSKSLASAGSQGGGSSTSATSGGSGSGNTASGNKASAPGITPTEITIGSHQPLTGPAAPGYSEIAPASNAYFQWVNDHGGVYGRHITYKFLDDGYNPANTTSVVRQLTLQDNVFAIFDGLGTPTHLAVRDLLNTQKVPDLFVASGCTCWNDVAKAPYTFGFQPDYTVEGKILGQKINQAYAGKKVGYFSQADDFGTNGVKGLDSQIKGADVVSRQTYTPTNTSITPQISALQAAGVEVIASFSIPAFTAIELLTAAKLNYHPTFVVSNVGTDPPTLGGLVGKISKGLAGASLIEGVVTDSYIPPVGDTSNPWIADFKQVHDKYISTLPFDGNVEFGMAVAYAFVQTMLASGQNPTRADVVKALESSHFQGPGLVPFSYSKTDHQGYTGVQIGSIKGGVIALEGTPYTTTDTGPIQAYTTAPSTPPPNAVPSKP